MFSRTWFSHPSPPCCSSPSPTDFKKNKTVWDERTMFWYCHCHYRSFPSPVRMCVFIKAFYAHKQRRETKAAWSYKYVDEKHECRIHNHYPCRCLPPCSSNYPMRFSWRFASTWNHSISWTVLDSWMIVSNKRSVITVERRIFIIWHWDSFDTGMTIFLLVLLLRSSTWSWATGTPQDRLPCSIAWRATTILCEHFSRTWNNCESSI